MPKTVYAAKVERFRGLILREPQQHKRISLIHAFMSLRRVSRIQIGFCRQRLDELRAEMKPDVANTEILAELEERINRAQARQDRRKAKREALREAAKPPVPATPVEEAPSAGESYAERIGRLLKEQEEMKKS